jgi:hypothetical protein
MSTRGNICVKVKSKDFNRVNNKILEKVSEENSYLYIYNHWDSYPSGLGTLLITNYNTYEDALELVLEGDCSFPGNPYSERESYEETQPKTATNTAETNQQEYLYVFEDDKWTCYDGYMNIKEIPSK